MADLEADYRIILEGEYQRRVQRNPRYSRGAYAKFLGVHTSYLSKLSKGKILLSLDVADRVSKKLGLDPAKRAEFLLSAAEEQRCHALYLIDPNLTECDPNEHCTNVQPVSRGKKR